jgi:hypothetical protein
MFPLFFITLHGNIKCTFYFKSIAVILLTLSSGQNCFLSRESTHNSSENVCMIQNWLKVWAEIQFTELLTKLNYFLTCTVCDMMINIKYRLNTVPHKEICMRNSYITDFTSLINYEMENLSSPKMWMMHVLITFMTTCNDGFVASHISSWY